MKAYVSEAWNGVRWKHVANFLAETEENAILAAQIQILKQGYASDTSIRVREVTNDDVT